MATISSLGIGSGLDSESIVTKLAALERQPLKVLEAKATFERNKISAFGQIQSQFSNLADISTRIATASAWTARTATSSNTAAATITATSTTAATSFTLDIDALATTQFSSSAALSAGNPVGAGTLTFRLGKWDGVSTNTGPTFSAAAGSSDVAIAVTATDTVSSIAAKINAGNLGVLASVFKDGTTERLQLVSKNTGADAGFRIQVTDTGDSVDTDDAGLSRLGFDPQTGSFGMAGPGVPVQYGQDAKARINGVAVTSKTNTLSENLPGVTINLLATTTQGFGTPGEVKSSVNMAVREDVTGAVRNAQDFVTAYNALAANLSDLTKYDSTTKTASLFQADSSVVGLQNLLRNILGSASSGSTYKRLNEVGIERQLDGSLSINIVKLGAAANNGTELQKLFTTDNKNAATNGFALKFSNFAKGAISTGGVVATKAAALGKELVQNGVEQARVNEKAALTEARLRKQYSALDAKMANLNALNAYVSQQVATWNKSTG